MIVVLDLNSEEGKKLQLLGEFFKNQGVTRVTPKGVLDIAVSDMYRDFSKLKKFKDFLQEQEEREVIQNEI